MELRWRAPSAATDPHDLFGLPRRRSFRAEAGLDDSTLIRMSVRFEFGSDHPTQEFYAANRPPCDGVRYNALSLVSIGAA
jgi:hypothetical protein